MTDELLISERHGRMAGLRLNRPARLNALNDSPLDALRGAIDHVGEEVPIDAVVITGAGRALWAGGDLEMLTAWRSLTARERRAHYLKGSSPVLRLAQLPLAVVAAVNGTAVGAGFDLALSADLCLAPRSACFVSGVGMMGLVPDFGGTRLLARMVGISRSRRVLGGERLTAATACEWGIVAEVTDCDHLLEEAFATAGKLALEESRQPTRRPSTPSSPRPRVLPSHWSRPPRSRVCSWTRPNTTSASSGSWSAAGSR